MDVAEAIGPDCEKPIIGIRPGEKIHEEMITTSDSFNTYDIGNYYTILPTITSWDINKFIDEFNAVKVPENFCYNSGTNTEWLSVKELRDLIFKNIDPNFKV